jgi:hypothetical protein
MRGAVGGLIALMVMGILEPAYADINSIIHECARLYTARNNFYHQRGLCFTRAGALELYPSNPRTCRYSSAQDLPISASEKRTIDRIVERETELGCRAIRPWGIALMQAMWPKYGQSYASNA